MNNGMFGPEWSSKVTVPVRKVGNKWEFFYGGDVPVRHGTVGDLVIPISGIIDEGFLKIVREETFVQVLTQGTELMVALTDRSAGGVRVGKAWPDVRRENVPAGTTRFERIVIGPPNPAIPSQKEGLWIRLKGLERSELTCSTVLFPEEIPEKSAISLNHAFTLLSQHYETHRISHTGNAYDRVFYSEANNKWYPISHLRDGTRVRAERGLIASTWNAIEEKLGWCQVILKPTQKNRRGRSRK